MRRQFGKTIAELGKRDPNLVLLYGDVKQNMDEFEALFPDRIFNVGICEQSMVSMAAGMALDGLRPVVYSLTPFLLERAYEQLKMDCGIMNAPVICVGYSSYPTHGPSQTPLNPRALVEVLPNFEYWEPKNFQETGDALKVAHISGRPTFISLTRSNE